MPLSAADLASLGETPITIRSTAFANVFIRMDGTGVTSATDAGGGRVNCQYTAGSYEKFRVRAQSDGSYAFESVAFPKVFLRLDGSGVTSQTEAGGGNVNCQYGSGGVGPYEKFHLSPQPDGSFSFESIGFPKVYLRLNGSGVTAYSAGGGGIVNAQFAAEGGIHEKFVLALADQRLDFQMQHQQQTQWCWAATSTSVAAYFNAATPWTQCTVVNAEVGRNDCCGGAASTAPCNQPWWLDRALTRVGHFNQMTTPLTTVQLAAELNQSTPVGARVGWSGGGGHFMVLRGRFTSGATEYVSVADPWYGDSDVTDDAFRNRYQGTGTWTHSYKTKR
ncbi:papain-like cysteine protease family protein [Nocardia yamanashiensis]|uniref:papain-like cysteine protease family protein n=1 Tax=Nocardia yamanashiensis TaxID=209247 RepID=UPI0009FF2708|nr:papain-like cysteine protease family protein [Nocardia yamanashiensis]